MTIIIYQRLPSTVRNIKIYHRLLSTIWVCHRLSSDTSVLQVPSCKKMPIFFQLFSTACFFGCSWSVIPGCNNRKHVLKALKGPSPPLSVHGNKKGMSLIYIKVNSTYRFFLMQPHHHTIPYLDVTIENMCWRHYRAPGHHYQYQDTLYK